MAQVKRIAVLFLLVVVSFGMGMYVGMSRNSIAKTELTTGGDLDGLKRESQLETPPPKCTGVERYVADDGSSLFERYRIYGQEVVGIERNRRGVLRKLQTCYWFPSGLGLMKVVFFRDDGSLLSEANKVFASGHSVSFGLQRSWHENGTLEAELTCNEYGHEVGWKRHWYADGKLKLEILFDKAGSAQPISWKMWDGEGRLTNSDAAPGQVEILGRGQIIAVDKNGMPIPQKEYYWDRKTDCILEVNSSPIPPPSPLSSTGKTDP